MPGAYRDRGACLNRARTLGLARRLDAVLTEEACHQRQQVSPWMPSPPGHTQRRTKLSRTCAAFAARRCVHG
eukprot:1224481-Rhodomonas_salina.1